MEIVDAGIQDKRLMVTEAGVRRSALGHGAAWQYIISGHPQRMGRTASSQTMTRTNPLKATGAHISIVGHITKDEVRARLTRTDMANGFANRFLFCLVKRARFLPHRRSISMKPR